MIVPIPSSWVLVPTLGLLSRCLITALLHTCFLLLSLSVFMLSSFMSSMAYSSIPFVSPTYNATVTRDLSVTSVLTLSAHSQCSLSLLILGAHSRCYLPDNSIWLLASDRLTMCSFPCISE